MCFNDKCIWSDYLNVLLTIVCDKRPGNDLRQLEIIWANFRLLKWISKLRFQSWPLLESNWSVDFNFPAFVVIFIFKGLNTFLHSDIK